MEMKIFLTLMNWHFFIISCSVVILSSVKQTTMNSRLLYFLVKHHCLNNLEGFLEEIK